MENPQAFNINENLDLNITLNNSGTISTITTECSIINTTSNNYTLNCEKNNYVNKNNLQAAMAKSEIDNDILLVNFDQNEGNTTIKYVKKSSGGLSAGAIVAIVLVPIVVLASVAGIIIFLNKKGTPSVQPISVDSNTKI